MSDWVLRAACKNHPEPAIFFPTDSGARNARAAKAVCQSCPVKRQCLNEAMRAHEQFGIWGGLSEIERKHLRRRPDGWRAA